MTETTGQLPRDGVSFASGGVTCDAWHFRGAHDGLATAAGRPCVVMAHGLAGTKDSGLEPFARGLAAAGLDVLAFDYRGFGASGGTPRQTVSMTGQLEDYRAAMQAAAALDGVDPQRLVLWGVSLAGGHVLAAGTDRDDVAAIVSLTPLVDGIAAGRHALAHHTKAQLLRSTAAGVRGRIAGLRGRPPVMMPVVGRPGEVAALTLPGCYEDYLAIAGPTWRNEIARHGRPRARRPPARQARRRPPLPAAGADRRLRPQRPAARRRQGRLQGARGGAALPVRPLRRVRRQGVARHGGRPPGALPDPASHTGDAGLTYS